MRLVLTSLFLIVLVASARADAAWDKVVAAAKKEGKLVLYSAPPQTACASAVAKSFEQKYRITVESVALPAAEWAGRLRAEQAAGRFLGDIAELGTIAIERQLHDGAKLFQPYGGVPNVKNLREPFAATEFHVPAWAQSYGILVSTDAVSEQQMPRVWRDLFDAKWRGRILADDPRGSGGGGILFAATVLKYGADFQKAMAKQRPIIGHDPQSDARRVVRGEYPLYFPQIYGMASDMADRPIQVIVPEDGSPYVAIENAVLRNAPHPNAARLFINHFLELDSQIACANGWMQPVVKGALEAAKPEAKPYAAAKLMDAVPWNKAEEMTALAKEIYP